MPFDNQMPGARTAPRPTAPTEIITIEVRCTACGRRDRFRARWETGRRWAPAGRAAACGDCGGTTVSWPIG